jgi:serine/threonine protein kinase
MEYLKGNTLHSILKNKLNENQIATVIKECLLALDYLHSKNIVHRDIHSENFLVAINGEIKLTGIIFN